MEQLATNLKALRKQNCLTQGWLAKKLNLTQQAYANYEKGVAEPCINSLIELSKIYGITIDEMLGLSDNLTSNDSIAPEIAKKIWFKSLSDIQQETIGRILKLKELELYKTNLYIYGLLEK